MEEELDLSIIGPKTFHAFDHIVFFPIFFIALDEYDSVTIQSPFFPVDNMIP